MVWLSANKIIELKKEHVPKTYYAKGNYFNVSKDFGIRHLIYPIPDGFGLGIHLTLELDHSIKFGPDVEWVDKQDDYKVDVNRKKIFANEITKYFEDNAYIGELGKFVRVIHRNK